MVDRECVCITGVFVCVCVLSGYAAKKVGQAFWC